MIETKYHQKHSVCKDKRRWILKCNVKSLKESGYLKGLDKDGIIETDHNEHKNDNL
jgi:predicted transcriptional regulator